MSKYKCIVANRFECIAVTDGLMISDYYYGGDDIVIEVPSQINGQPVVGESAFETDSKNVTESIVLPDTIKIINSFAFCDCTALKSIVVPSSVKKIGSFAFNGCTSLTDVTILDGVEQIDGCAFGDCTNLKSIKIPKSVKRIGDTAFIRCKNLESVTLPKDVCLGKDVFADCKKLKITYSDDNE